MFGSAGVLWCLVFTGMGADSPEEHGYVSKEEVLAIKELREKSQQSAVGRPLALRLLLGHPTVVGIMIAEAAFSFLWYFWLSWMPSFFHDAYGLSTGESGTLGLMSYWVAMPAPFVWSKVFSICYEARNHTGLLQLRTLFFFITFLGASGFSLLVLLCYSKATPVLATVLVMSLIICLCSKVAGQAAVVIDCGGSANSARVGALMHLSSAMTGFVSNVVVGYFLATPSLGYSGVFMLSIGFSLLGLITLVQTVQVEVIDHSYFEDQKAG
ncbi:unnamed protein product [Durusdinium trenchii]|uniref:Uncharacterized protein n=1 Tax=Durusdinium trenchii TaxID=1381693 RepID=A0ABP0HTN7_9DINO